MKAKLTFNLPEDQHEWDNAIRADAMYCALWDLSQELRTMWKLHGQCSTMDTDKHLRNTGIKILNQNRMKELLEEFIEWARECGEDVFYIFEFKDEAIEKFMKEKETFKSE